MSPVLPDPVELVAGGEGRPELIVPPGLGGSGRSGTGEMPTKMAEDGRRLALRDGRAVGVLISPGA